MLRHQAIEIIRKAITKDGILASSEKTDNYARVWSRDAMMTGFTGILIQDSEITEALERSILTLAKHQGQSGQIPSNVNVVNDTASYGSLVGRVDATTWWVAITCEYLKYSKNDALKLQLRSNIELALKCLDSWEFNARGLIYTPLGGNWADEYITSGYTLYDNVLRYWAIANAAEVYDNLLWQIQAKSIKVLIETNFRKNDSDNIKYHETAYKKANEKPYLWASLNANGYDERFDLAGNALAILLGFDLDLEPFTNFLDGLNTEFQHWMLPVFYPVVFPQDTDWKLLENNYSYNFKNKPYHFHNGGSWPIFLGWRSYALSGKGIKDIQAKILNQYEELLTAKGSTFKEYYTTDALLPSGTDKLCFSASGYLLMTVQQPK